MAESKIRAKRSEIREEAGGRSHRLKIVAQAMVTTLTIGAVSMLSVDWSLGEARADWVSAIPVVAGEAPQSSQALTVGAIRGASASLLVNIYELTSPEIADALIERVRAGVPLLLLQEGEPVGGLSSAAVGIRDRLLTEMKSAGAKNFYLQMTRRAGGKRRFRFNHAKYIVQDGGKLLIGSENYSPGGQPVPGARGNRGWETLISDTRISREFSRLFAKDATLTAGDVIDLTGHSCGPWGCVSESAGGAIRFFSGPGSELVDQEASWVPQLWAETARISGVQDFVAVAPQNEQRDSSTAVGIPAALFAEEVHSVLSPETSKSGLLELLNGARHTIDIQQMTFDSEWGNEPVQSPLLQAVIAAARRGVRVRVLLNDEFAFLDPQGPSSSDPQGPSSSDPLLHGVESIGPAEVLQDASLKKPKTEQTSFRRNKNRETVNLLNQLAQAEGLKLRGLIANTQAMGVRYIHNKGLLVDGDRTLISSINWNRNSVERNREAAVVITGSAVNAHYAALFNQDWKASLTARQRPPRSQLVH